AASAFALAAETAQTQEAEGPDLTIERVFASPSLTGPSPRSLKFSPYGTRVTFLRPKDEDRTVLDLWAMDVADGRTYRLVDARALAPEERELSEAEIQFRERARISQTGVVSYDWDESGDAVLVPLDGDVFYVDVETGEAERLMQTEAFETDFKVSPDGRHVSFIRDQNLWVHDLETGEARALTTEGGDAVSWGVAEFVAQEEMQRYTGYWWSPEGDRIAVARVDETPVQIVPRFGISAEGVEVTEQRYPRAGTPNALVELHVIDLASGERTKIDLGEETDIYLARVNWNEAGDRLYVQRQNREQTVLDLLGADPGTGETAVVLSETAPTWINLTNDFTALEGGDFLWTSERTGFRHVYRVTPDGETAQITSGDWVVDEISGVGEDGETVYFEGWTETPLERHLYAVPMTGGDPVKLTDGQGVWSATLGQGGSAYIGTYQDPATPPQTGLYETGGARVAWIEENALDAGHPYAPYVESHLTPEFGTITAPDGETALYWSMLKPETCTEQTPCPAIVHVYGGPHVQTVTRGFSSPRDQLFADRGYVLFKIDNRGSWNRGHAFEAALHDRMGTVEVEDQLAGLEFLETQPFVDADRVGLWGWSYGGYMTLMTTLRAPGAFDAAVAGAPVTDWSLYDTHYTERYMDTPQANAAGYEDGSAFAHVDNYTTPTLIIHGMADDNVTFDHSTRLFAELQAKNADFEMMTYPGQRHGVRPPELQTHLWTTILRFFDERLAGEADR
ncbi:MAG: DPP IV N-terminal domain-containing protein, partial [Oceanicaulis sp.]